MDSSKIFKDIKENWGQKALDSKNTYTAVGRSEDDKKLAIICDDIVTKLLLSENDSLLEVGCGSGVLLSKLHTNVRQSAGVDYSENSIKLAQIKDEKISFECAEAANLPFPDESFEKVLCYSVFHYFVSMDYAQKAVDELIRVCKPNGLILIGDIPSSKHFHLSPYYRKISFSFLYTSFKNFLRKVKGSYRYPIPLSDPKKWLWYDLNSLINDLVQNKFCEAEIFNQPEIIQWREWTPNHRFDILIKKY